MGLSLQEQLLKAGLVDEKKVKALRGEKHREVKQQRGGSKAQEEAERQRLEQARKAQAEKEARDRELNQKRQEDLRRRELNAQVRQIVEQNRLPLEGGEEAYNFVDGALLKRLYVTPDIRQGLTAGRLVPVRFKGRYEVVTKEVAEKIAERDPKFMVREPEVVKTAEPVDDYYAQFQVPDDLIW